MIAFGYGIVTLDAGLDVIVDRYNFNINVNNKYRVYNLLQQSRLKNFPFLSVIKEVNNARNPTGIDYLNTLETKNI